MKKITIILMAILMNNLLFSQTVLVRGKVTAFHKYAVKNIVVKCSKSSSKVLTNEYGVFEIACLPNETLIIESESFEKIKHKIKDPKDSIIVNLVFKDTKKSRESALANGIISEENLAYATQNLKNENNNFDMYNNVYDLIKGRFAGVDVMGGNILIRGVRSMNSNNYALLVVDGTVVQDLTFLSPSQVGKIEILKGPETSQWGSRGANGVVIITTKR